MAGRKKTQPIDLSPYGREIARLTDKLSALDALVCLFKQIYPDRDEVVERFVQHADLILKEAGPEHADFVYGHIDEMRVRHRLGRR